MPLAFKLRDEENERINSILKQLIGMDYVPDYSDDAINEVLQGVALDLGIMLQMDAHAIISLLEKMHFDWANAEQFADFLLSLAKKFPEREFALSAKAVAIYEYVQSGSKTFSWTVSTKIASAKNQRHDL